MMRKIDERQPHGNRHSPIRARLGRIGLLADDSVALTSIPEA
jgi:hypothetical protein